MISSQPAQTEEKDIRIYPYGGLETNRERALEDEKHSCCGDSSRVADAGVVLYLVDEASLNGHGGGHQAYHGHKLDGISIICQASLFNFVSCLYLTNGLRPILSMRNHGMKEATKNHVCKKPDMSADVLSSNPMLLEKSVLV